MKDIKFRAWDDIYQNMVYLTPHDYLWYGVSDGGKSNYFMEFCERKTKEHCADRKIKKPHLMQYTGLKDKNGVEIYEGDIVKYKRTTLHDFKDEEYTEEWIGKIVWSQRREDEDDFNFNTKNNSYQTGWYAMPIEKNPKIYVKNFFHDHCEVIGNIYENPEVLEEYSK